jgi:retinol dehydrogenase 12
VHVLVTGANRGLGLATALRLRAQGASLTATVRAPGDIDQTIRTLVSVPGSGRVDCVALDLASFVAVRAGISEIASGGAIDAVVHNAGILLPSSTRQLTVDGHEACLQVHAVAPLLMTQLLQPCLRPDARIVWVTSRLHKPKTFGRDVAFDFDDPDLARDYHGLRAYKNSKLAQLWLMRHWTRLRPPRAMRMDAVCPGFVPATAAARQGGVKGWLLNNVIGRMAMATSKDDAASAICARVTDDDPADGRYFEGLVEVQPSAQALDEDCAERFWAMAQTWIAPSRTA